MNMKSVKDYIVNFLGIDPVVGDMWAVRVILNILGIVLLVLLFALPAIIWESIPQS